MNQVKIDKVDNGFVVSLNKSTPPVQLGAPPGMETLVTVHTTFDDVLKYLKEEC